MDISHLLRNELAELSSYVPHAGDFGVRLDANEAPNFWSNQAKTRFGQVTAETLLGRYPDAVAERLRQTLATRLGLSARQLLIGTGSDEVIALLLTALCKPRGKAHEAAVVTVTPTFVMYRMSARARGQTVVEVPLDPSWDLDAEAVGQAIERSDPNLVFIASPNNPTSNVMSQDRVEYIVAKAEKSGALVVLDEAYAAYCGANYRPWIASKPNVAVLGTLSKIGLAALRVGWLAGNEELVREIDKVRQPYNLPTLSQAIATTALTEFDHEMNAMVQQVCGERVRLSAELESLGYGVTKSDANFLWVKTAGLAERVFEQLKTKGVLVRSFHQRGGRLGSQLRITIGSIEENNTLLEAVKTL